MSIDAGYANDEILLMDADDAPSESLPSMPIPSAPPPAPMKPSSSTRLLVLLLQAAVMALALLLFFLFAGIAALVLVHLFVAGRALRRRRASSSSGPLGAFHGADAARAGLSKDDLRRLPSARYASRGRLAASLRSPDCAVCLEGLREGDRCRVLPGCGHGFHKACVDKWLVRTPACPLCRAAVGGGGGWRL